MITYQRNNIIFRIASSDAISKFKSVQAHTFLQLSRSDIKFDIGAREVLLLEYDRMSQWLYRLERMLLSVDHGSISKQLTHAVLDSFREEFAVIECVLDAHHEVFSAKVVEFTKIIHGYSCNTLHSQIGDVIGAMKIDRAYANVAELVSEYLQHLLTSLYEFSNNVMTKQADPFLCIGPWCSRYSNEKQKYISVTRRIEFFKNSEVSGPFAIKNYGVSDSLFEDVVAILAPFDVVATTEELIPA